MKIVAKITKTIVEYNSSEIILIANPMPATMKATSPLATIPYPILNPLFLLFKKIDAGIPHPKILLPTTIVKRIPNKIQLIDEILQYPDL